MALPPDKFGNRKTWEVKGTNAPLLDKEISIRIRPRKIVKGVLTVLILLCVFYLGRWSASDTSAPEMDIDISGLITGFVNLMPDFSSWGSSADEPAGNKTVETAVNKSTENLSTSSNLAPATEETTAESQTAEEDKADLVEEVVITSYSKAGITVDDVKTEWRTTFGKIIQIGYTITNNEAGTIKPDYLILNVEGYDDFDKKISLPLSSRSIAAGKSIKAMINVPQGFAYSELSAGDLKTVSVTLHLFDAQKKEIATHKKDFDISGK